ncbi:AraC family transcriptional regulator [Paenibacillus sp. GCM10027626]|uniref:AraC family transcriptional regulator n=1 Tax=Paenibacillus sp. GCM10027626 TaxID=3273411 RepID=UPI00362A0078
MRRDYNLSKDFPIHITRWVPLTVLEPFHWHNAFEVGYCFEGKGQFYFEEKRYEVRAGDVFVVSHMEKHRAQSDAAMPSTFYFVKFDGSLMRGTENELLTPFIMKSKHFVNRIAGDAQIAPQIGHLMHEIWKEMQEQNRAYKSMVRGLLIQVCTLLFRYFSKEMSTAEWSRSLQAYNKLQPALRLIHERFSEDIRLEHIAECLALSPSRSYHLFKETIGEGFKEYLTKIRIQESKKRLRDPNASITEVYLSCGFQSQSAFYRAFKLVEGMTPKEYSHYIIMS